MANRTSADTAAMRSLLLNKSRSDPIDPATRIMNACCDMTRLPTLYVVIYIWLRFFVTLELRNPETHINKLLFGFFPFSVIAWIATWNAVRGYIPQVIIASINSVDDFKFPTVKTRAQKKRLCEFVVKSIFLFTTNCFPFILWDSMLWLLIVFSIRFHTRQTSFISKFSNILTLFTTRTTSYNQHLYYWHT